MRYEYCPNDPIHFATNLRREQGTRSLTWDNARGQDVLIVQTPFDVSGEDEIRDLCRLMEKAQLQKDKYTEVKPRVWVRFVTAADKARLGGCPINTEASTYTVFACRTEGGLCSIYAPQRNQVMISASCSIPMQVHVGVQEEKRSEGLFRKKVVPTGYYILDFPQELANGYRDGDVYFSAGGMDIPVTRQMLAQGRAYVRTPSRPEIRSRNGGLALV